MTDESVFASALAIGSPSERAAYLDRACAGNSALRKEVEDLLAAHAASNALDRPPGNLARTGAYESASAAEAREAVGAIIGGKYKLIELLGEGGMGAVYMAQQTAPVKRLVAVKVIRDGMDSRQVLARFEAERQALAMMDHPNIAKVLEAGTTESGRPFFVMELVKGVPITRFCDDRKLSPRERLELFVPVCQAIQHAHQKGIIHRDVKPGNVLVALYDGKPVPKVIDFGVAKAAGQPLTDMTLVTGFGAIVGTPEYMSPEQAELNQLDVDTRSDVFALGVLLYELLTGTTPLDRKRLGQAAILEILRIVREEEPPKPSTRISTSAALVGIAANRNTDPARLSRLVKGELDWIVMKALEKDRNRRYDSATALAKDVERHLKGDAVEACPPTLGYRLRKAYRKNRTAIRVASAFVCLAFGAAVMGAVLAVQAKRAEKLATENERAARQAEQLATENEEAARRAEAKAVQERDLQRRTRYAAEMNLLQAAYSAKDLGRVKKLLETQRPAPGETDLRGPEFYYWNRKFHSHESDFRIPCLPTVMKAFNTSGSPSLVEVAPDGNTVVVALCGKSDGLTIQVWDLALRSRRSEFTIVPGSGENVTTSVSDVRFSPDSRQVMVQRRVSEKGDPDHHRPLTRTALIDVRTGGHVTIEDGDAKDDTRTGFSDDLEVAVFRRFDQTRKETTVIFQQVADRKELGRLTSPGLASASLCPDHRHALLRCTPIGGIALPEKQAVVVSYWELGVDKPLWQQEHAVAGLPVWDKPLSAECRLTPDGRLFHRMVLENGYWHFKTCETGTGRVVDTRLVARGGDAGDANSGNDAPKWVLSADGRRIAYQTWSGFAVCDLGLSTRFAISPSETSTPVRYTFETLDGPPTRFHFLPDGRLAAVWSMWDLWLGGTRFAPVPPDAVMNEVIVRVWGVPPVGAGADWATLTSAISQDGRLFALSPRKRVGPPGDGRFIERLCVVTADGASVFATDLRELPAGTDGVATELPVNFSADGRYLYVLGEWKTQQPLKTPQPFIVWDVQTGREVGRVIPEPGTRFVADPFSTVLKDGNRLLLQVARIDAVGEPGIRGELALCSGKIVEIPSCKPILDLTIPDGVKTPTLGFETGDVVIGHTFTYRIFEDGTKLPVHEWDATTGAYRGPAQRKWPFAGKGHVKSRPDRWVERGDRVVRLIGAMPPSTAEVWDVARRGVGDQPLFRREFYDVCELSRDGSRLLVAEMVNFRYRAVLYCTTTGREVLSLPWADVGVWGRDAFPRWSPDDGHFWYGVDGDGKPVGWDFRPLTEPTK